MENNAELGDFLRARRARLSPEDVGLEPGSARRRVSGLRREEVARLANISADYYSRLEQGRRINVSMEILNSVARALRLTAEEARYLAQLAFAPAAHVSVEPQSPCTEAPPSLERVSMPAATFDASLDVVEMNAPFKELAEGMVGAHCPRINNVDVVFSLRERFDSRAEWEFSARQVVALLRRNLRICGRDAKADSLVRRLQGMCPDFRRIWDEYPLLQDGKYWFKVADSRGRNVEMAGEVYFVSDFSPMTLVVVNVSK